jgi:cell division protein FtsB
MENKSIPTVIDLKRIIKGFAAEVESLQKKYHVSQRQAEEISRSHGQLAARTSELEASHEQLARSNQQLENENRFLTEQVRLLRSGLFGKKSEAYPAQMPELFDEAEMESQKESVSGGARRFRNICRAKRWSSSLRKASGSVGKAMSCKR